MTDTEIKRPSGEWCLLHGVTVLDPDGWNRRDFQASWLEPITETEFRQRVAESTVHNREGNE